MALRDDVARMQPYFDLTDDQLAFFEPLFGPYPLDHYGLAFADSVPGLAMETQGRSLFSRHDFQGSLDATAQMFLAHELAHQWFGDAVTPADWSDLWLNESFATYGQWLWLDHAGVESLDSVTSRMLAARQLGGEPTGRAERCRQPVRLRALRRRRGRRPRPAAGDRRRRVLHAAAALGRRERRHVAHDRGLHRAGRPRSPAAT